MPLSFLVSLHQSQGRQHGPQRVPALPGLQARTVAEFQALHGQAWQGPLTLEELLAASCLGIAPDGSGGGEAGGGEPDSSSTFALDFPCVLRPAARPVGLDLHARLFELWIGEPCGLGSSPLGARPQQQQQAGDLPPLLAVLDKAACLLAARLLFPGKLSPAIRLLAAAHCAAAACQAASLLLLPSARAAARRRVQRLRQQSGLVDATARGAGSLGGLAVRYGEPAAALLAAGALWAYLHPSSAQIGECIAALIPVLAGYNQTARHCAVSGLSGDVAEELWRRRHKWAAQHTAGMLSDLPDEPPLGGAVSCWEALNIRIGAVVNGLHFGCLGSTLGAAPGVQLWGSVGVSRRPGQRQPQAALEVVAGHVAALPAAPLEDGEAGLEAAGAGDGQQPSGQQHDLVQLPLQQQADAAADDRGQAAAQQQQQGPPGPAAAAGQAGGGAASPAGGCMPQRGGLCDSPSEMMCSPQSGAAGGSRRRPWQQRQLQEQQEQGAPADATGAGSDASSSSSGGGGGGGLGGGLGADGSSWRTLSGTTEAQLREAATAAAAAGGSGGGDPSGGRLLDGLAGGAADGDFMHPGRWASARQAAKGAAHAGADASAAHSDSTGSVSGSSNSVHSFLLPGRRFSSSEESSAADAEEEGEVQAWLLQAAQAGQQPGQEQGGQAQGQIPPERALAEQAQQQPAVPGGAACGLYGEAGAPGAAAASAPLFGRGDHAVHAAGPLSAAELAQLALRAAHLMVFFAPFLLLGSVMLLLASQLDSFAAARRRRRQEQAAGAAEQAGGGGAAGAVVAPAAADGTPLSPAAGRLRTAAFKLLLRACRRSGAAFIKWGQWSSTREDIFPQDFCRVLSELHDRAPVHGAEQTRRAVEAAFGRPLEELFVSFEAQPLASGSIAQVHRAVMMVDGQPCQVAVKVCHPGVAKMIWQDFQLLRPLAALTGRVRSLRSLNLSDSVAQFSHTMTAQADLQVEAAHLARFYANFAGVTSAVRVPRPLEGYCTPEVLVESFESGRSVAHFIRSPHPQNTRIVAIGVDTYLKMLLEDNFVHTDLHPGNILVRPAGNHGAHSGDAAGDAPAGQQAGAAAGDGTGTASREHHGASGRDQLELVLLDFGLAQELSPTVRRHFISFLHMIARGDGRGAAAHLLCWAERQRCPDPDAFADAMEALFRRRSDVHSEEGIDLDAVIKSVLHLARRHEVSIDSNYAELVIGVCVIVGFATSLDRRVNLMDAAAPCFLYHALTGRVSGRLYM